MIGAGFRVKGLFFDRPDVMRRVNRAERAQLSRFGAFVRTGAQSLILRRPARRITSKTKLTNRVGISLPGEPPVSHTGLLVKGIFFNYEPERHSVVIGPVKLDKIGKAPEALEYGGQSTIAIGRTQSRQIRTATFKPRPSMTPAFQTELAKMPPMWRDSIR